MPKRSASGLRRHRAWGCRGALRLCACARCSCLLPPLRLPASAGTKDPGSRRPSAAVLCIAVEIVDRGCCLAAWMSVLCERGGMRRACLVVDRVCFHLGRGRVLARPGRRPQGPQLHRVFHLQPVLLPGRAARRLPRPRSQPRPAQGRGCRLADGQGLRRKEAISRSAVPVRFGFTLRCWPGGAGEVAKTLSARLSGQDLEGRVAGAVPGPRRQWRVSPVGAPKGRDDCDSEHR